MVNVETHELGLFDWLNLSVLRSRRTRGRVCKRQWRPQSVRYTIKKQTLYIQLYGMQQVLNLDLDL